MPSAEYMTDYFNDLKLNNPEKYNRLLSFKKTSDEIGSEKEFNVLNLTNTNKPEVEEKLFVLKRQNEQINIWVEKAELANNHVTDAVINDIFNGLVVNTPSGSINPNLGIYEIDIDVYGTPPDKDGNGRVDFLLTDILDGWDGEGSFIGGFFYPNDQTNSPGSNRADILYVDTYPGIYREINGTDQYLLTNALGTVSHEFQHLIQFNNDPDEETWVNEGLSELSSFLCGYGLRSPDEYLNNAQLQMTDWDNDDSIPHYARVALWTYYLYERFGTGLIRDIAQNTQNGTNGINAALLANGASGFNAVILDFFKTMISNDPARNPQYAFSRQSLQNIRIEPRKRIDSFPSGTNMNIRPYSVQSVSITNGDSLNLNFSNPFNNTIYINETGYNTIELLMETAGAEIIDNDFGAIYHTKTLNFINTTASADEIAFITEARPKYDLITLEYGAESPSLILTSDGNTNAIQYISPRDSAFVKAVEFYSSSSGGDIRIHQYESNLAKDQNPASISQVFQNVFSGDWQRFDIEDLKIPVNSGDFFNVGIEYLDNGAMGYEDINGTAHLGRSFLKGTISDGTFEPLRSFSIDGGNSTLTGTWLFRVEVAAPFTGQTGNGNISGISVYPNPFSPRQRSLTISYDAQDSNDIGIAIYNTLGQRVYNAVDKLSSGLFLWNGENNAGQQVAAGQYFISVGPKNKKIFKMLIILD